MIAANARTRQFDIRSGAQCGNAIRALLAALLLSLAPTQAQAQAGTFRGGFTAQDMLGHCKETGDS